MSAKSRTEIARTAMQDALQSDIVEIHELLVTVVVRAKVLHKSGSMVSGVQAKVHPILEGAESLLEVTGRVRDSITKHVPERIAASIETSVSPTLVDRVKEVRSLVSGKPEKVS